MPQFRTRSTLRKIALASLLAAAVTGLLLSCAGDGVSRAEVASVPRMIHPDDSAAMDAMLDAVAASRVVMVGETHDRYDHHLNQLAVIRGLRERGVDIAIGMEYFQRPFQRHLDDFIAGRIDEAALLERTEWDARWRFDIRLYRDILAYARAHSIPLVALNASSEMVSRVSQQGIDALPGSERALLPARIELADGAHRRQLEAVFRMHGNLPPERLQRFLEVQYLWDQVMARSAADYLAENPDRSLVILAGSGHLLHAGAIPERLERLYPARQSVLVTETGELPQGAAPDFVLAARDIPLVAGRELAGRQMSPGRG